MIRSVIAGGIAAISRRIASLRAWRFSGRCVCTPLIWDSPTRRNCRERDKVNALATRHRRAGRSASPEIFPTKLAWISAPYEPLLHPAETRDPSHPFLLSLQGSYSPGNRLYSSAMTERVMRGFRNRLGKFIANDGHHLEDIIFKTCWQKLFYISFLVLQRNFVYLLPFL